MWYQRSNFRSFFYYWSSTILVLNDLPSNKECPACAIFISGSRYAAGCPDEVIFHFRTESYAVNFIKSRYYKGLNYFDKYVLYVSGCEDEDVGRNCLIIKVCNFLNSNN